MKDNLPRILEGRRLEPAIALMRAAGREDLARARRLRDTSITIGSEQVILRNQEPLIEANLLLDAGWAFEDLIEYLNAHVYFWPGTSQSLDPLGSSFLSKYQHADVSILRLKLSSVTKANPGLPPLFSKYNTGAGRHSGGKPSPRGPNTFVPAGRFKGTRSEIREVGFHGPVILPPDAELAPTLAGPWRHALANAS